MLKLIYFLKKYFNIFLNEKHFEPLLLPRFQIGIFESVFGSGCGCFWKFFLIEVY